MRAERMRRVAGTESAFCVIVSACKAGRAWPRATRPHSPHRALGAGRGPARTRRSQLQGCRASKTERPPHLHRVGLHGADAVLLAAPGAVLNAHDAHLRPAPPASAAARARLPTIPDPAGQPAAAGSPSAAVSLATLVPALRSSAPRAHSPAVPTRHGPLRRTRVAARGRDRAHMVRAGFAGRPGRPARAAPGWAAPACAGSSCGDAAGSGSGSGSLEGPGRRRACLRLIFLWRRFLDV